MNPINTISRLRTLSRLLLTCVIVVGLAACADQPDGDSALDDTTAAGDTLMTDPGGMQADPGAMQGATQGDTVDVRLVATSIVMPSTLREGTVVFRVTNDGTQEHNFEVEGHGEEHVFPQNLQPGETQTMEVDLRQGSYEVYCPVSDHRSRGMELDLTVEPSAN